MRILVIDDQSYVRAAVASALKVNGHEVLAVESGPLALKAFDESGFDAAIVDVFMLEMDGMTLINALRDRAPHLPIVVISGGADGGTVLDILATAPKLSGVAFLQKPFRPNQLAQAIREAVDRCSQLAGAAIPSGVR